MSLPRPALRLTLRVLLAVMVTLLLVGARVNLESARELRAAERAAERAAAPQDLELTLRHLRRAARWYAPFNPSCTAALQRLREIAQRAEAAGDDANALSAWRSIRASLVAAESLYTPHATLNAEAETHIAALMARVDPPPIDAAEDPSEREQRYLSALRDHGAPHPLMLAAVWVGFVLMLVGLTLAALKVFDAEDRVLRRSLWRNLGLFGAGLSLLLLGLGLA